MPTDRILTYRCVRHGSAEGGHPIEDFTAVDDLTPLPSWVPGAKALSVCDTRARAPSGTRRRVSYPVSDSMSCRRRARGPVPCAVRALGVGALIQRGGRAVAGMLTIATAGGLPWCTTPLRAESLP